MRCTFLILLSLLPLQSVMAQSLPSLGGQEMTAEFEQINRWERKLQAATVAIDVVDAPLSQAAQILSQRIAIPIRLDERAMDDMGLSPENPITFALPEIAAEAQLRWMLKEYDLTYLVDRGGVVITTPEEAESRLRTKFYPVDDLFDDPRPNYDFLLEVILTCIEPESWEELGGHGSIVRLRHGLVVNQTYQIHRRLEGLLKTLRQVQKLPLAHAPETMISTSPDAEKAKWLDRQLDTIQTSVALTDAPLEEVIAALSKSGNLPMWLDRRALEDVGLSSDTPINLHLKNVKLRHIFDVIAEQYDLAWMIRGEVLVLTTPEEAESELETRVFPVKDLVRYAVGTRTELSKRGVTREFDQLIQAITTAVEPESWEELGGPGAIAPFYYTDCLVVLQLGDVHRQLAELLRQIRAEKPPVRAVPEPPATARPQPMFAPARQNALAPAENVIVVSYTLPRDQKETWTLEELQKIAEGLQQAIAPQSWNQEEYFADATHNGLFVRHRRDIQRRVADYLTESGLEGPPIEEDVPEPSPIGGFGQQRGGIF